MTTGDITVWAERLGVVFDYKEDDDLYRFRDGQGNELMWNGKEWLEHDEAFKALESWETDLQGYQRKLNAEKTRQAEERFVRYEDRMDGTRDPDTRGIEEH